MSPDSEPRGSTIVITHSLRNSPGLLGALVIGLLVALSAPLLGPRLAPAAEELKIALVVPLSGRWARQGQLVKMGAEMAVDEINAQGGIKSLGGARIVLREADAGDSVEKAVSAAQRALSRENISAGIGAWLSSFTLGVTEVAERLQVPWLTLSYADSITERGFKYTFQTSPVSSVQAELALDLILDLMRHQQPVRKAAIVGDNTAASVSFFKPLREKLLKAKGIELVVDEVWTPPLADATSIVQKLRAARPDVMLYSATTFSDSVQVLQKVKEFDLKLRIVGNGAWLVTPEYLKAVDKALLDGVMTVVAAHPLKGQEELVARFKKRTGEPFMTQDPLMGYAHVWIVKEAAERARSADPRAIRDAIAGMDLTSGPAAAALHPARVRYDERGRRAGAAPVIAQWQNGEPFTIFPARVATARPIWLGGSR
jgi:branched-chain amino acid transport system substrate-binding protein